MKVPEQWLCRSSEEMKPVIGQRMKDMAREARIYYSYWWWRKRGVVWADSVSDLVIQMLSSMTLRSTSAKALSYLRNLYRRVGMDSGYGFAITVFDRIGTWQWAGSSIAYSIMINKNRWTQNERVMFYRRAEKLAELTAPYPMSGGTPRSDFLRQIAMYTTIHCVEVEKKTDTPLSFASAEQKLVEVAQQNLPVRTTRYGISLLAPSPDFATRRKPPGR